MDYICGRGHQASRWENRCCIFCGELVSIATTDKNGDASFLTITEVSETSREVPNLYTNNEVRNGNGWIGRPLILGSYYIEEISRSEGYERSVTGKNLSESNRTGKLLS